ncbi:MAG TPA: T9SS type A sorting domain-containing protein [Rhodothermales bacterium]|nr:T9SS type A sorting domain-containing protein [Rhodothermales bacterium]
MYRQLTILFLILLLGPAVAFGQQRIVVTDASINAGETVTWSNNAIYELDGVVFVEDGATLNIEAGTRIEAQSGQGNDASALVIAQGGTINAQGTAQNPIVFTSVLDDGTLTIADRGLWGGVVLLGRASTNNPTDGGIKEVEGINEIVGENDTRAQYGGTNDNDNSGTMRYVSIRYTGINVGAQTGNEIQGLTLGAVGAGTTIEYIESFASADDGYEFFGGTVNTKYLVSAFNADDAFDTDEGYRGKGQFWFAILAEDAAGAAAEMDGATGNEFFEPFAHPQVYNATYIGPGVGNLPVTDRAELVIMRDNTGGVYANSIFTDFETADGAYLLTVEDIDNTGDKTADSQQRLEAGDLEFLGNIWYNFAAGTTPEEFVTDESVADINKAAVVAYLNDAANANRFVDPDLAGVSRTPNTGLDPRPNAGSPALGGALAPTDGFFTATDYVGAFGKDLWIQGWTALDALGYVGDISSVGIEEVDGEIPSQIALTQNYPNPFNPSTTIEFALNQAQDIRLTVYDLMGREVTVLATGTQPAGTFRVTFDASNMASGMYLYRLDTESGSLTKKMMLVK